MSGLVSIFVCGVQKGGTTSLHAHLREHAELSPPSRQEIHFFDEEDRDWIAPDYSAIDSLYAAEADDRLRFDVTPIYVFWPPSIPRIRAYNPAAKLIFLFRDPLERAFSQWCMEYARGHEKLPFHRAIREGRNRLAGLPPFAPDRRLYSYIERGFYGDQVRRVLTHFPREQLLFLRTQDLRDNHIETLARISSFLEIAPFPETGSKRERTRPRLSLPSCPTEEDRAFAARLFREDIREFSALTSLKVSDWQTMR